ncbi:helix-turn-helix domain-containing protein [Oleidesulfovibrio alaskensis]|jgi:excisionase family DNA binding protein|uniref:helix-turn-helix domain-containing protein n=1 Tax=Oleidesulfovibrio alaskensis TaxID=58180 RepID=UPI000423F68E|nr:helix-turn-helix domain-containing protein [Oleidesulfovibrio alaskensis]
MSEAKCDFYTVQEVRRRLSWKSAETVRRGIKAGRIQAAKVGGQYRIPRTEYERIAREMGLTAGED